MLLFCRQGKYNFCERAVHTSKRMPWDFIFEDIPLRLALMQHDAHMPLWPFDYSCITSSGCSEVQNRAMVYSAVSLKPWPIFHHCSLLNFQSTL